MAEAKHSPRASGEIMARKWKVIGSLLTIVEQSDAL
jgi:hypothetical protein